MSIGKSPFVIAQVTVTSSPALTASPPKENCAICGTTRKKSF